MNRQPFLLFVLFFSIAACNESSQDTKVANVSKAIATCYGYTPCNACSNCSMCKFCKAGGTCGVCDVSKKEKTKPYKAPAPSSGRCKATTKKGSQCSRNSRSGGYCWQHGG